MRYMIKHEKDIIFCMHTLKLMLCNFGEYVIFQSILWCFRHSFTFLLLSSYFPYQTSLILFISSLYIAFMLSYFEFCCDALVLTRTSYLEMNVKQAIHESISNLHTVTSLTMMTFSSTASLDLPLAPKKQ